MFKNTIGGKKNTHNKSLKQIILYCKFVLINRFYYLGKLI
jgi:hypothetical protein